jgi:protein-disulfide isomerase
LPKAKIAVALAFLLVAAGAVVAFSVQNDESGGPADAEALFSISDSPRQGSEDAPVKLIAFESPQCSSCRFFHVGDGRGPSLYERLIADYVEPGHVQYVEKAFYVGYPWERVGVAAQKCVWHSHPDAFFDLTRAFYHHQPDIRSSNVHDFIHGWATQAGLDGDALLACVDADRFTSEGDRDVREGRNAGARGTPTFFIVGPTGSVATITGPQSYDTFQVAIQNALAEV